MCAMLEAAAYLTGRRRVKYIFFDGRTFSTQGQIEGVLQAASQAGARWRILHVTCADAVAEERLGRSLTGGPSARHDLLLALRIRDICDSGTSGS